MSSRYSWFRLWLIAALALSAVPMASAAPIVHAPSAGSFIVNTLADTNTQDSVLSLREALLVANGSLTGLFTDAEKAQLGGCTFSGSTNTWTITGGCGGGIADDISVPLSGTINLVSALPTIADGARLIISGPTGPGVSLQLNGAALSPGVAILTITSNNNELYYLHFAYSKGPGLYVTGNHNLVHTSAFYGNTGNGLLIDGGSDNVIQNSLFGLAPRVTLPAGCLPAERNLGANVVLTNGAANNQVNYGYLLCSSANGIWLLGGSTQANTVRYNYIGGADANLGNTLSGVEISLGSHDNLIEHNTIGHNGGYGIMISGSNGNSVQNNEIGLTTSGPYTMPNALSGIFLQAGAQSNRILTNTIGANGDYGVWLTGVNTRFNTVRANTILSNTSDGIQLEGGTQFNTIGSPIGGPRSQGNRISGNGGDGIHLTGATTAFNWVLGNSIGLNDDQTAAQPNAGAGIVLDGAASNIIGITGSDGNVVSGNLQDGIALTGNAADNSVQGNTIGVNFLNTRSIPNGWSGAALILGAHNNTIGGGTGNNANLISHSAQFGVYIADSGTTTNTVSNNSIYNSSWDGITLQAGASGNIIGSVNPNERNYIAGGARSGIYVAGANANRILRNDIYGNAYYGIILDGAATTGTYISRTVVFQNGYDGIGERNGASLNVWTEISAYANGGLGIDKQANTDLDNFVNAPVARITSSSSGGGITTLNGTGQNGTLVEVYGVAPDPSGFGEGKTYLGTALVSSGHWTLNVASSAASCFTLFENSLGIAASEFGANTCRVFLPVVLR